MTRTTGTKSIAESTDNWKAHVRVRPRREPFHSPVSPLSWRQREEVPAKGAGRNHGVLWPGSQKVHNVSCCQAVQTEPMPPNRPIWIDTSHAASQEPRQSILPINQRLKTLKDIGNILKYQTNHPLSPVFEQQWQKMLFGENMGMFHFPPILLRSQPL